LLKIDKNFLTAKKAKVKITVHENIACGRRATFCRFGKGFSPISPSLSTPLGGGALGDVMSFRE